MAPGTCIGGWSPGIGDPSLLGWFTVAAYGVCVLLCWRARRAARREREAGSPPGSSTFWMVLAVASVALGVNKQLDLQTGLMDWGRTLARAQGWYESRQAVKLGVGVAVLLAAAALCVWLAFLARHERRRLLAALLGSVALWMFVVTRAASIHLFDKIWSTPLAGRTANAIWELGGITVISAAALAYRRSPD